MDQKMDNIDLTDAEKAQLEAALNYECLQDGFWPIIFLLIFFALSDWIVPLINDNGENKSGDR